MKVRGQVHIQATLPPPHPPYQMPIGRDFGWDPGSVRIIWGKKKSLPLQWIELSLSGLPAFSQCAHEAVNIFCTYMDALGSRSETPGKFWDVVLEKDGKDQLDRSCEKLRSITESQGAEEYPIWNKETEG